MNKILFITDNDAPVTSVLSDSYEFICKDKKEDGLQFLEEQYLTVTAILVDAKFAAADDYDFVKQVADNNRYLFIPVIEVLNGEPTDADIECLKSGVVDFIMPPFHKEIIENRIANAIRIKDSATFGEMEHILKALPSNIYLKDVDCRYVFATHYWHHLEHSDDPDWTIRGKTDVDIRKDKENAMEALEKDREVIRTGRGSVYTIEINTDGVQEFFEIIKEPVWDSNGKVSGIVGLINNVTEQEVMKEKLKEASIIDGLTGLYNRKEIQTQIEKKFEKQDQKFTLVMIDIDNFKAVNDTYGHQEGDNVIVALADILNNKNAAFPNNITVGRWGGEEFMMLLHDTEVSAASMIAELIRQLFSNTSFPMARTQTISLGVTQVKPNDTPDSICVRVDDALYKAKKTGKNRVVVM